MGDTLCRYDAAAPGGHRGELGGRESPDSARRGHQQTGRRLVDAAARSVRRRLRRDSEVGRR